MTNKLNIPGKIVGITSFGTVSACGDEREVTLIATETNVYRMHSDNPETLRSVFDITDYHDKPIEKELAEKKKKEEVVAFNRLKTPDRKRDRTREYIEVIPSFAPYDLVIDFYPGNNSVEIEFDSPNDYEMVRFDRQHLIEILTKLEPKKGKEK